AIQFEVEAPEKLKCVQCNCSICTKSWYVHLIVPGTKFRLMSGEESISTYSYGSGIARHYFCKVCGIKPFYIPRSNPDGVDVNVNCLEPPPDGIEIEPFDGQNWEEHAHTLSHLSKE
ncbi:MAG: GFA family protein, partial [Gammaproteobacteria bacterium]|nr:GFA family protein [Gammaproteobacteria bacterium]